jgi:hypothetical protein
VIEVGEDELGDGQVGPLVGGQAAAVGEPFGDQLVILGQVRGVPYFPK